MTPFLGSLFLVLIFVPIILVVWGFTRGTQMWYDFVKGSIVGASLIIVLLYLF